MNFIEALQAIEKGKKVRCKQWFEKDIYIYKKDNVIVYNDGGYFDWSFTAAYVSEWDIYKDTSEEIDALNKAWENYIGIRQYSQGYNTVFKAIVDYLNMLEKKKK